MVRGGHFLGDDHTLDHFKENWQPDLTDRRTYEDWQAQGSQSMGQRTKAKIEAILKNHRVEPLAEDVDAQIEKILLKAKSRI